MTSNIDYRVGDTANGHVLGEDGQWHPIDEVQSPTAPEVGKKSRKKLLVIGGVVAAIVIAVAAISGGSQDHDATTPASNNESIEQVDPAADYSDDWGQWSIHALPVWSDVLDQYAQMLTAVEAEDSDLVAQELNDLAAIIDQMPTSPNAELNSTLDELAGEYRQAAEELASGDFDGAFDSLEHANELMMQASEILDTEL